MFSALILCHRGRKGWEGEVCANGFGWTFSRKKAPFGSRSTCLFGTHAGFQTAACALGSVNERPPAIFFARRCCCAREGAAPAIENIPFFIFCFVWFGRARLGVSFWTVRPHRVSPRCPLVYPLHLVLGFLRIVRSSVRLWLITPASVRNPSSPLAQERVVVIGSSH